MSILPRFTIPADDLPSLQGFYADVFGWTVEHSLDWLWKATTGQTGEGVTGALVGRPNLDFGPLLFITVPDLLQTMKKAEEKGATVLKDRTPVRGLGWFCVLQDPQNNPIGLWQEDPSVE